MKTADIFQWQRSGLCYERMCSDVDLAYHHLVNVAWAEEDLTLL
jgi:hypothetical protein